MIRECVAVAPDAGSAKRAGSYAQRLDTPLAFVDKRRVGNNDEVLSRAVVGDVTGKHVIIFDDEISTAGSLMGAVDAAGGGSARHLRRLHPRRAVRPGHRTDRPVTDQGSGGDEHGALPPERRHPKIRVLSVAPLFAEAIRRVHTGQSIDLALPLGRQHEQTGPSPDAARRPAPGTAGAAVRKEVLREAPMSWRRGEVVAGRLGARTADSVELSPLPPLASVAATR